MRRIKISVLLSLSVIAVYCLVALLAPVISPYDPFAISGAPLSAPDEEHILGTNDLAQDIFSRLVWGTRATLILGFLGAVVSVFTGTAIGIVAGYYGGRIDEIIMRILDIVMTIPFFPLLLVLMMHQVTQHGGGFSAASREGELSGHRYCLLQNPILSQAQRRWAPGTAILC